MWGYVCPFPVCPVSAHLLWGPWAGEGTPLSSHSSILENRGPDQMLELSQQAESILNGLSRD